MKICAVCLRKINPDEKVFIDPKEGKLICEECAKNFELTKQRLGKFAEAIIKKEGIYIPYLIPI